MSAKPKQSLQEDTRAQVLSMLDRKVKLSAIGNDSRTMRDVAIDLLNASGEQLQDVAHECFLSPETVKRLAREETQRPQADTLERIYRHFGYELQLKRVVIRPKFANAPKTEVT
jgi:hypothetical protein